MSAFGKRDRQQWVESGRSRFPIPAGRIPKKSGRSIFELGAIRARSMSRSGGSCVFRTIAAQLSHYRAFMGMYDGRPRAYRGNSGTRPNIENGKVNPPACHLVRISARIGDVGTSANHCLRRPTVGIRPPGSQPPASRACFCALGGYNHCRAHWHTALLFYSSGRAAKC